MGFKANGFIAKVKNNIANVALLLHGVPIILRFGSVETCRPQSFQIDQTC
jgi:hypothetical protein